MSTKLSSNIAKNIEYLRKARGITQSQLQGLSNVPRTTISLIESGEGNPTISVLTKIACALGVSVQELIAKPMAPCRVCKHSDLPFRNRAQGKAKLYNLLNKPIPGIMYERFELKPEVLMVGTPHTKGTREYFTPTHGRFLVTVDGEEHLVEEGDVFAFQGDVKHSYKNLDKSVSKAISFVLMDGSL